MSRFIQPLEGRTLLSATSTSIANELTAVQTAGSAVQADLLALQTTSKADLGKITADLKGSPKTNVPLLKKLAKDQGALVAKIKADTALLLKGTASSTKGAADGNAIVANPALGTNPAKIQADVTKLATASSALSKLQTDAANTSTVNSDVDALTTANPTLTALTTDGTADKTDLAAAINKLLADATTYSNALGSLKTDLSTLLPQPTTTPSLIGDYKGTLKTKSIAFGLGSQTVDFEIIVTNQTLTTLTGTIIADGNSASGTIEVTELTTGKLTMKLVDSGTTVTLNGKVNVVTTGAGLPPGSVISGSGTANINGNDIKGDFVVTKIS